MGRECRVTYIKHSGFLLETEKHYLLFDYWKGEIPPLNPDKDLYIFASHAHHDHYTKKIYSLKNACKNVYYVLSFDIREADDSWKERFDSEEAKNSLSFLDPYEKRRIGGCMVETLKSTDEGVAFLVTVDGIHLYHAGDLHWWEWPGEPEEENQAYIAGYKKEMEAIKGRKLDLAFVVLDPRQDDAGGRGMDYFLAHVGASYVFPMHLWKRYDLIRTYKQEKNEVFKNSQIMDITASGQEYRIEL